MGQIKLPTGQVITVDELPGNMDFTQIVRDLRSADLTDSFRISVIGVMGRLGSHAKPAVEQLESLASGENTLLKQAATQALKKINSGAASLVPHAPVGTTVPSTSGIMGATVTRREPDNYNWQDTHSHHGTQFSGSRDYGHHHSSTSVVKKPDVNKVLLTEIKVDPEHLEEGARAYTECRFCTKMCLVAEPQKLLSRRLSGTEKYFCNFCLRNEYYSRMALDTMIFSLRGIIGYYYYAYYIAPKSPTMYLMDLKDMVELHAAVGSSNPLMRYDPETYCWFVDFGRIGKARNRLPLETVLTTVIDLLACFNIYENVKVSSPRKFYQKIQDAMLLFMNERKRLWDMPVFAPTLYGCDIPSYVAGVKPIPVELLHGFVPGHLLDNHGTNKNRRY